MANSNFETAMKTAFRVSKAELDEAERKRKAKRKRKRIAQIGTVNGSC